MQATLFAALALPVLAIQRGPLEAPRDRETEAAAKHNLDVARYYITRRKAYTGALDRLKEIVETYPEFSRIDEVVFWIGEANLKLNRREVAAEYYNKLLKDYSGSEFAKKAQERLNELKPNDN
jgi:outer membrane protein assembly factor BamD (BamD/ComL family)